MLSSDMYNSSFSDLFMTELLGSMLSSWIPSLIAYILLAVGLYTIAKRRGINNPWLAWIPFGQTWVLGCISDQYQYVAKGQEKSKRKSMLLMEILTSVAGIAASVLLFTAIFRMIPSFDWETGEVVNQQLFEEGLDSIAYPMMGALLLCLAMLGFAIALVVLKYMALYDLFRSCDPNNSFLFTILSVFLGAILQGVFVLVCRNKDYGMPPRSDQQIYAQNAYIPQQTWQQPQQNWQPPQQTWQQPQQNWQPPQQTWQPPQQPAEQFQPTEEQNIEQ